MFSRSKIPRGLVGICVFLTVAGIWYWWAFFYNPLVSDKKMIEHFNLHREEFEEIVRRYRYFEVGSGVDASVAWLEEEGTKKLMEAVSIYRIAQLAPDWIPAPYAMDAEREYQKLKTGKRYYSEFKRMYGTLALRFFYGSRSENEARKTTFIYGTIWKEYAFYPEAPRVVNNRLYWPDYATRARHQPEIRVLSSLDYIPDNWMPYECVYRRLRLHWFLRMCNGR